MDINLNFFADMYDAKIDSDVNIAALVVNEWGDLII